MSDTSGAPIPPAPRLPRWHACLRRRWGLGLAGAILLLTGIVVLVILATNTGSLLPFDDLALDDRASRTSARVLGTDETAMHEGGRTLWAIRYEFTDLQGNRQRGTSYTPVPELVEGDDLEVEFLAEAPEINRLRGTLRAPFPTIAVLFTSAGAIGIALLLVWLRGVLKLRMLLRDGAVAQARILQARPDPWVNPPQLRVDYELRVPGGAVAARQYVRRTSPLGHALASGVTSSAAIFDDDDPTQSRLVHASDFTAP